MKRSEMLRIMFDAFKMHVHMCDQGICVDENDVPDDREHRIAAQTLLYIMESIGMMPPPLNHDDYRWEEE